MALLFCACGSLSTDHLLPKLPGGDSVLQGKDSELANVFSALIEVGETEDPYSVIYSALSNYEKEITIKNTDAEQIKKAFLAVLSDHPELFWVANGYSSSGYSLGAASVVTLVPIISDGLEVILQKQQELQDTVNRILWQIPKDASDYEKALFLHDWLVQTTEYDLEAYQLLTNNSGPDQVVDSATAYGCLVLHKAICSGYSTAYQLLLHEAGIEAGRVSGTGRDGDHEWNYLWLDGDCYFVDVTWDDPVSESSLTAASHEYFCITTEELLLNHVIDAGQDVPLCTATTYNYHRRLGLFLPEYSFDAVSELVDAHRNDEVIEMAFSSPAELHKAESDLFDRQAVFNIPAVRDTGSGIAYSIGSSNRVLQLFLKQDGAA